MIDKNTNELNLNQIYSPNFLPTTAPVLGESLVTFQKGSQKLIIRYQGGIFKSSTVKSINY